MTQHTPLPSTLRLVLSSEAGGGRIVVPLESYLDFDQAQSHQLDELVDRWSHLAAPGASRSMFRREGPTSRL